MFTFVLDFLRREDGPTAVEYAIILALIVEICVVSIISLGFQANKTDTKSSTTISTAK